LYYIVVVRGICFLITIKMEITTPPKYLGEEPIMITNNKSIVLMRCRIEDMIRNKHKIQNWELNRPPDMCRCEEISKSLLKSEKENNTIDWVLYLNFNSQTGNYYTPLNI
jgi:hypothetical protein